MFFQWPSEWVTLLNAVGWPVIQLSLGYVFTRMPASWFSHEILPIAGFEKRPGYWKLLRIKAWKARLPDGAAWFSQGFPKKHLSDKSPQYVERFIQETRRSEISHWVMLGCSWIFFLWNPLWAFAVMFACGIILNLPPILVQRYNRLRLQGLLVNLRSVGLGCSRT